MAQDASAPQPGTFAAFLAEVAAAGGQAHMQAFAESSLWDPALAAAGVPEQVILDLVRPALPGRASSALGGRPALPQACGEGFPPGVPPGGDPAEHSAGGGRARGQCGGGVHQASPGLQDQVLAQARGDQRRRAVATDALETQGVGGVPPARGLPLRPALHRRGVVAPRACAADRGTDGYEEGGSAPCQSGGAGHARDQAQAGL